MPAVPPPAVRSLSSRLADWLGLDAPLAHDLLAVAGILVTAWVGIRLLRILVRRIEHAVAARNGGDAAGAARARTIAGLLDSVGTAAILCAAGLLVLGEFVAAGPLAAAVGALTVGLSFGAQGLIRDVIGGFFVLFEDQYRIGDTIRAAGVEGTVEEVTLRCTLLRDGYGAVHFVPNGSLGVVSNQTRVWSRAVVDVGVAYSEDVDRVMAVLRAELKEFAADALWRAEVVGEPQVAGVQRLGDSAVEVRVWVNVRAGRQSDAERELRRRIKNRFDAEGIAIPQVRRVIEVVR